MIDIIGDTEGFGYEVRDERFCVSPAEGNEKTEPCDDITYNVSPPYRLRTKRSSVLKSVKKQLALTF